MVNSKYVFVLKLKKPTGLESGWKWEACWTDWRRETSILS